MSVNRVGTSHYPAWQEAGRMQKNGSGIGFASRMADMVGTNASENGRKANAATGRNHYVGGDTVSIYSMGVYSRKDISASQDLDLPIETERYKIEDATYVEGVPAYKIKDKETERGLYIREDQLMVQKDEKTGLKFVINMDQPFSCNVLMTGELKGLLDEIAGKRGIEDSNYQTWLSKFNSAKLLDTDAEPLNHFSNRRVLSNEELGQVGSQKSETKTEIIVKPDGSRVLVMTMSVGGMETTMSLEISKPTKAPNENSKRDTDNNMSSADAKMNTVSDEMSNISTEA